MIRIWEIINKSFGTYNIKGLYIEPTYWQAGAIVILIFFLLIALARVRYMYVHWSLGEHAFAMFFWGFLFALILEGFLMIGGRTLLTEVIGWENAPKPLAAFITAGRERLVNVLGTQTEVPPLTASENQNRVDEIVSQFQLLSPGDAQRARFQICQP